eukprot:3224796-Amphidinium_carterae.1
MFASAVSAEGGEDAPLPPLTQDNPVPPPPVPEVLRQHAKAAALLPYQFYLCNGKVQRMRPRQR